MKNLVLIVLHVVPGPLRKHAHAIYSNFFTALNDNFQMKKVDNFLIFAQNIDHGYSLEPPHIDRGYTLEPHH